MSSPAENKGEIDGRPVTWFYQRPESDQEGRLSWAEGTVTCKSVLWLIENTLSNSDQHQTLSGHMSSRTT